LTRVSNGGRDYTYYKILGNGDLLYYGKGFPVAQDAYFGSGWWTLPLASGGKNKTIFSGDTTVNGTVPVHGQITTSNYGDTTLSMGGRNYVGTKMEIASVGMYGSKTQNYGEAVQFIFIREFGYIAINSRLVYAPIFNANSGVIEVLTGFELR
jgi:hypothetical protein